MYRGRKSNLQPLGSQAGALTTFVISALIIGYIYICVVLIYM